MANDKKLQVAKAIYKSRHSHPPFELLPDYTKSMFLDTADAAIAAMATPEPSGPTVKVRVAVMVDAQGYWEAFGWQHDADKEVIKSFNADMDHAIARYNLVWLTATIPLPTATEVAATVEQG